MRLARALLLLVLAGTLPACSFFESGEPPPPAPRAPAPGEPEEEPDEPEAEPDPEPAEPEPDEPAPDPEPADPDPEAPADESVDDPREEAREPGAPVVLPGSVLPRERIVAFYGNPRSERMGILGEHPPETLLAHLDREVEAWRRADPATPVRPALHLIAVMAAADPGPDSLYSVRTPSSVIEEVLSWADRRNALVFLDIQPGLGDVAEEARRLLPWLEHPRVHLALDPEWNMPEGTIPGRVIGSMDASEINAVSRMLAELVEERGLPPKVLVVHRFTERMVTNVGSIELDPRVQVVLHMDGWGRPANKITTYRSHVANEPIPYTGFKLFYRNDTREGSRLMTPEEVLALTPPPIYIQYQ